MLSIISHSCSHRLTLHYFLLYFQESLKDEEAQQTQLQVPKEGEILQSQRKGESCQIT